MKNKLKNAFELEMKKGISSFNSNELEAAFYHFERAHILGQSFVIPHTRSHWWMLKVGLKRSDIREIFGQITRIIASIIFSRIWVPLGNTGGANVNPIKPMPIPKDLEELLNSK